MKNTNECKWALSIILIAVFSTQPSQAAEAAGATAAQDILACIKIMSRDPQYAEIGGKLPLQDMTTISIKMLADESRPTPKERKEIADWFDERDQCWKASEDALQKQWPPEIIQLSLEGKDGIKAIGVELYKRKITFGEANKQIQQLGDSIRAKMVPIIKQYQAEIAAQKAAAEQQQAATAQQAQQRHDAAEQLAVQQQANASAEYAQQQALKQQRTQMLLNYLQAQQQAQAQQLRNQFSPPPSYNTNCVTNGNFTNCTTH